VVTLALYPSSISRASNTIPDLLQLVTLPLLVLAYLNAFEKRTARAGLWLGLAGALALMTKYWVLTMIGAIGISALVHPDRLKFLLSPAPWVAIATLIVAMIPHLIWLKEVDFVPLTYAGDVYGLSSRAQNIQLVLGYLGHNLALLAAPVALAALALAWVPRWWGRPVRAPLALFCTRLVARRQSERGYVAGVPYLGHPDGGRDRARRSAPCFSCLYENRLGYLAVFSDPAGAGGVPSLRVQRFALFHIATIWLAITLATLVASPDHRGREIAENPTVLPAWRALRNSLKN